MIVVLNSVPVRRSFDSLRSLRMTGAVVIRKINDHLQLRWGKIYDTMMKTTFGGSYA